jgi:hypothetical protein
LEALDRLIMAAVQYRSHETLEAYRACYEIGRPLTLFLDPAHAIRKIRRVRRLTRKPEADGFC